MSIPCQLIEDVDLATRGRTKLSKLNHSGGIYIYTEEVYDRMKAIAEGRA